MLATSFKPLLAQIPSLWQPVIGIVFIFIILLVALLPIVIIVMITRMVAAMRDNNSRRIEALIDSVNKQLHYNDSLNRQLISLQNTVQAQNKKLAILSVS